MPERPDLADPSPFSGCEFAGANDPRVIGSTLYKHYCGDQRRKIGQMPNTLTEIQGVICQETTLAAYPLGSICGAEPQCRNW